MTLQACIPEVLGLCLGRLPSFVTAIFCVFPQTPN